MSRTSSDQRLFVSALPSSDPPSGPGNMSGKSVRTVADQLLDMVSVFIVFGDGDYYAPARDIDGGHGFAGEGEQHAVAIGPRDFHHVAGAVIVDGGHLAQHPAFAVLGFQADQ